MNSIFIAKKHYFFQHFKEYVSCLFGKELLTAFILFLFYYFRTRYHMNLIEYITKPSQNEVTDNYARNHNVTQSL